jgi:hypothetical protein
VDLLRAADRIPTEDYDFRPTPDMRNSSPTSPTPR